MGHTFERQASICPLFLQGFLMEPPLHPFTPNYPNSKDPQDARYPSDQSEERPFFESNEQWLHCRHSAGRKGTTCNVPGCGRGAGVFAMDVDE